jgi:serine/threonine protein kinase
MRYINLVNLPDVNEQGHPLLSGGKTMDRDRNLLFGVLAVQLRKVTPTQLVDIAGAWAMDPSRCLGDRLLEVRIVSSEDKVLLDGLVDQAIKTFDGDASLALESFGGEEEVYHSFCGSVAMTDSGGIKSVAVTKRDEAEVAEAEELGDIPAVEEMPSRYTYVNEYGRGGMGRVLLVHDEVLGRDLALKELLPNLVKDGKDNKLTPVRMAMPLIARFLQEAKITGQLEHPSIVPVYELGHRKDGTLYYTMKLVRGKTLHKAIHECKNLEERLKLLPHFVDLCNAIAYAHKHGVIHRDIKPMNVMIGEFGETVVLDWGLAKIKNRADIHAAAMQETVKALNLGDDALSGKTRHGDILGTPLYMPPEQAKGDLNAIDERSDIYSLGAVLYEILTGNPPFGEQNVMQTIYQVINETPKSIVSQERRCPPDLVQFCNKAMEKLPDNRYQKAKEFADAVEGSKLRPPKSRLFKYFKRAAVFVTLFIPACTVGLYFKSENDLNDIKAYYETQGVSMSGRFWKNSSRDNLDDSHTLNERNPLCLIYSLDWQYPYLWSRVETKNSLEILQSLNNINHRIQMLNDNDIEHIRSLLTKYEDVLQDVHVIAEMPFTHLPISIQTFIKRGDKLTNIPLPNLFGLRMCASLLRWESILHSYEGNYDNAILSCIAIHRYASHLQEAPGLISAMMRGVVVGIGCETLQDIINNTNISKDHAALLRRALESSLKTIDLSGAYEMELALLIERIQSLRTNTFDASPTYGVLTLYNSWPLRFWLVGDAKRGIKYLSECILITQKPYFEVADDIARLDKYAYINDIIYPFLSSRLPSIERSTAQSGSVESAINQAILALALKEYYQDNNVYPANLNILIPAYIEFLPKDPFTNNDYEYQLDEQGYTLYGSGKDKRIGLGKSRRTMNRDNIYRLSSMTREFYTDHNRWPESFEEMVPEYIPEVPINFMTGKPYRFIFKDGKPSIEIPPLGVADDDIIWVGW